MYSQQHVPGGWWINKNLDFQSELEVYTSISSDDVIKWKHFPRYWPFVREFPGEFHTQRPVTRSFDVFFDLRLNKCKVE